MSKLWYVVQANRKQELLALENLKNKNFVVFLPRVEIERTLRGKSVKEIVPLFPPYLFVELDMTKQSWRTAIHTKGVQRILGYTEKYVTPLPKGFVEDLLSKANEHDCISVQRVDKIVQKYRPGMRVLIKNGLFVGFTGICSRIQKDFAVLILALQCGRIEVELPVTALESI